MEEDQTTLSEFAELLAEPEALAAALLWNKKDAEHVQPFLLDTTKQLFRQVEQLARLYRSQVEQTASATLSGLDELYVGGGGGDDEQVDIETIWGQVDLQNEALQSILKPSIRKLAKASKRRGKKQIRLLEDMASDESEVESVHDDHSDGEREDEGDGDEREEEDEEAARIRGRMERAMADMEEEEEEEEEEKLETRANTPHEKTLEEDVADPAREDLNDGFFDLHEMEAFADEEEEYLPDSAFGQENPEEEDFDKDKRTFHQKQRDGDVGNLSDEDDEEETLLTRKVSMVRRKRYRMDDEVGALYSLYEKPKQDEDFDDNDDDDDVVNMTAADIFGKPRKNSYYERKAKETKAPSSRRTNDADDDDSWNDYEFNEKDKEKDVAGWNDHKYENEGDDSLDEAVPMKGDNSTNDTPKKPSGQSKKLEAQTKELEKEMLAEKPWQMTGETTGKSRPTNSLLEATPEFEVATKMVPIITVKNTKTLEEIIKDRILKENWDDVVPRELPDVGWHAKRGELPEVSQEKSKLGLGELYEREYLKKAVGYDVDATEKESEEEKAKNEMKSLFASLCSKLDALSNYHFAPRPLEVEAEVRPVTKPAIAMEEVLPLHVSDARGVAPEEVYGSKRGREGVLRTESELDQQDRKRLRSTKKAARRKKRKQKLADEKLISRLQPGLGLNNPYEKRKMQEELSVARARGKVTEGQVDTSDYRGSGTFFQRMQEETQQSIQGGKAKLATTEDSRKKAPSSSAFKL